MEIDLADAAQDGRGNGEDARVMSASIEIPFAIGEEVWHACVSSHTEYVTCPECDGTKALTIIKGNGESISVECNYCQRGYEPSRGVVERKVYPVEPRRFLCRRITDMHNGEVSYSESDEGATCYSSVRASDLFRDKAACEARCAELNEECRKNDERCAIANLESKRRNLAFSSHYWTRQVKNLERDLELARARLAVCKHPKAQP